ncbi:MAG: S8 family serine peptidase, partial [Candidatus Promineifilaceae bacterium]|nr:S8 family serine peptidase [Candidatus Promineifilaceae bacterium]
MSKGRFLIMPALLALIVMALSLAPGGQAQVTASISVEPVAGPPGTMVTVSGTGFDQTNCGVELYWDSPEGQRLGSTFIDGGDFTAEVMVPVPTTPGPHAIVAVGLDFDVEFCGPRSGDLAEADFRVTTPSSFFDYNIYLQTRILRDPGIDSECLAAIQDAGQPTHAILQLELLPGMEEAIIEPRATAPTVNPNAVASDHFSVIYLPLVRNGQGSDDLVRVSLQDLEELGISLLAYLNGITGPGTAYLATIPSSVVVSDPDFTSMVRGLVCLEAEDKIQYGLLDSLGEGETAPIIVTFFSDVEDELAQTILREFELPFEPYAFSTSWQTEATAEQIVALANQDAVQWIEFGPIPDLPAVDEVRAASNVDIVQDLNTATGDYGGLSGAGVQIGIRDTGVDNHHNDFAGRIIRTDHPSGGADGADHGTHVAGIAAGSGFQSDRDDDGGSPNGGSPFEWRGMAPRAEIAAYEWGSIPNMLIDAVNNHGADVTNHSYILTTQGRYVSSVATVDAIIRGVPLVVPGRPAVWAAANQGNWGPRDCDDDGVSDGNWPQYPSGCPAAFQVSYFSVLAPCKNCLAVANLTDALNHNAGSSMGPTMDGRLKPEVSAIGSSVFSVGADLDSDGNAVDGNGYRPKGGTSMASPAVAGITALLLEQYADTFGVDLDFNPPLPSTTRALLIHTATDLTGTDGAISPDTGAAATFGAGPDWLTGYGLVNAEAAVAAVQDELFVEDEVSLADVSDDWIISVVPGQTVVRVTLAWDDLPGTPNSNATAVMLVNDLDLTLVDPDGNTHRPLVLPIPTPRDCDNNAANGVQVGTCAGLDGNQNYFGPAAEGVDRRNNVEQIVVTDPGGLTPGNWTATVSVLNADGVSVRLPLGGDQSYSLVGVLDQEADLAIEKSASPSPVSAGEKLLYEITVTNNGPDLASNVTVLDTLPVGVEYDTDTDDCTLTAGTGPGGEDQLTCLLGDVPAGDSQSFTVQVTVDQDLVADDGGPTTITNTAAVFSSVPDPDDSDNSATVVTIVNEEADLRVTKECKPDRPVAAGDEAVCTIWVENLGPSAARDVVAVDEHVSDGTFHFGDVTPDPECSETANPQDGSGTVTCELDDLDAGETVVIKVPQWSNEWIDLNDHVTVTGATLDPDPGNNQDEDHVEVRPSADLAIDKHDFPDPVVAGSPLTYTLTITNMGPSEAEDVRVE